MFFIYFLKLYLLTSWMCLQWKVGQSFLKNNGNLNVHLINASMNGVKKLSTCGESIEWWYLQWYWALATHCEIPLPRFCWFSLIQMVRKLELLPGSACHRVPTSFSFTQVICLSPSPLLCLQPPMHGSGKWLMGLRVIAGAPACVCLCKCVCPQCAHCNVTGLCNWNGNEPISDCSGVPPFAAFTPLFQLCQAPLCLWLWASLCVGADST